MSGFSSGSGLASVLELAPRMLGLSSGSGLATALELLSQSSSISSKSLHSWFSLSAASAAAAAAASITFLPAHPSVATSFHESGDWTGSTVAYCDKDSDSDPWIDSRWTWDPKLYPKHYDIELKPLFSAFRVKALGATALRAFLVNFLPLLEAYIQPDEDDLEDEAEHPPKLPPDPSVAFRLSFRLIAREVTVITTRRVIERIVVRRVSPRTAWKLLKDVPKSAVRKAQRHYTRWQLFTSVCRTTFRAQLLGVAANWIVQFAIDVASCLQSAFERRKEENKKTLQIEPEDLKKLALRTAANTLRAGASLTFASLGAGLGTVLIRPNSGTWIGITVGEFAGPFVVQMIFDSWLIHGTIIPPPSGGFPKGGKGGRDRR